MCETSERVEDIWQRPLCAERLRIESLALDTQLRKHKSTVFEH